MAWCRQEQAITWATVDSDLRRHMASLGHNELSSSLWPMTTYIWDNIGPGNGLLTDDSTSLPGPMLTYHQ